MRETIGKYVGAYPRLAPLAEKALQGDLQSIEEFVANALSLSVPEDITGKEFYALSQWHNLEKGRRKSAQVRHVPADLRRKKWNEYQRQYRRKKKANPSLDAPP